MTFRPRIRTIKPEIADAEFRGFFYGEGNVDLCQQGRGPVGLAPRARITVRADDLPLLEWARDRFGGCISHRAARGTTEASAQWQLTGADRIRALLDVLEGGYLPSKKRSEFALLREAVDLVGQRGRHADPTSVARRLEIRRELQDLKRVAA